MKNEQDKNETTSLLHARVLLVLLHDVSFWGD
jgi:hypothetical protein